MQATLHALNTNTFSDALASITGVQAVYAKPGSDATKLRLSIFVEKKDHVLDLEIIEALNKVADELPEASFDYSVLLLEGRKITDLASDPGERLYLAHPQEAA